MNPRQSHPDRIITLWMQITRLLHQRMVQAKKSKNALAVNPMQMHALIIIKEHDGLTMTEFAQFLRVTSPSATSFANRLVRLKWIKRTADSKNRKLVRLRLTDAGSKMIATKMKEHTAAMRELFGLLSTKDQEDFVRILANLHTSLAKHTQNT